jgi:predicted Zn-dependent protease
MARILSSLLVPALAVGVIAAPVLGQEAEPGVKIDEPSFLRELIPAETVERMGEEQYLKLSRQAVQKGALLPESHPQVVRLRRIAADLLPHAAKFNERAKSWRWEVNAFNSRAINAFCMPGGKIAFFTGIIEALELTDDEVAMVMGHEIAHALREHVRDRLAKSALTNLGAAAVSALIGGGAGELARVGGELVNLKFSRDDETEADLIGMELAARAGYDPRAGITLWQKMTAAAKGAPPQWLSTHPSGPTRIDTINANLQDVMPLYEQAKAGRGR